MGENAVISSIKKKLQEKQSKEYQDWKDSLEEGWKGKLTSNEEILRK